MEDRPLPSNCTLCSTHCRKGPTTLQERLSLRQKKKLVARCDNAGLSSLLLGRQRLEDQKLNVRLGWSEFKVSVDHADSETTGLGAAQLRMPASSKVLSLWINGEA